MVEGWYSPHTFLQASTDFTQGDIIFNASHQQRHQIILAACRLIQLPKQFTNLGIITFLMQFSPNVSVVPVRWLD